MSTPVPPPDVPDSGQPWIPTPPGGAYLGGPYPNPANQGGPYPAPANQGGYYPGPQYPGPPHPGSPGGYPGGPYPQGSVTPPADRAMGWKIAAGFALGIVFMVLP